MIHLIRKIIVALLPNRVILRSKLPDGSVVFGKNSPGYGGRGVFIFREELEYELKFISDLVAPGETVIDGGANVGVFTVLFGKAVGDTGTVIAVEPFPESAAMNLRNIVNNSLRNVRLRVCCLSDLCGSQSFYLHKGKPNSFSLLDDGSSASFNSRVTTIDKLVADEGLTRVDFIKLDVEGVEEETLKGAENTIRRFNPTLLVENTITSSILPSEGYVRMRYRDSHNVLLVAKGSEKENKLRRLGFNPEA
jgi:FkbM family methyltransferase